MRPGSHAPGRRPAATYGPAARAGVRDAGRLTHLWLREGHVARPDHRDRLAAFPHLRTLVLPDTPHGPEAAALPAGLTVLAEREPREDAR